MPRRHVIISGTGRAGTTFLMQLFTQMGLPTGFHDVSSSVDPNCNAGMEVDIRDPKAPYIIKSPWLCDYLAQVLESGEVEIDHAIIPVRELYSAAESRVDVTRRADPAVYTDQRTIPGGLWHTDDPREQQAILARQFYNLVYTLAKYEIPTSLLCFPRIVVDPEYLFAKINALMPDRDYPCFLSSFNKVARPELIHTFS